MNPSLQRIRFRALIADADRVVERGELVIESGVIRQVCDAVSGASGAEVLDLSDHLLLPGFVNAHCHLSLSVLHETLPRKERFTDWVRALLKANAEISQEQRLRALRAGAQELLASGVTALGDYVSPSDPLTEREALPFRQVAFLETLGFRDSQAEEILDRVRSVLDSHASNAGLLRLGLAPHAPYSVSPRLFQELKRLAVQYGAPFSCHVAEFDEEVRFLEQGGGELEDFLRERDVFDENWKPPGKKSLAYLDDLGVLESMAAVHVNAAHEDLALLAARGACAVFCPGSTRWFGRTRYMPVRELIDRGVSVALGTDSLASNDALNFLRELKIADDMLPQVSRREILRMATEHGAQALGLKAGTLAPGYAADLVAFRIEEPPASWVDVPFETGRQRADFVMVDGKAVFSSSS